MEQSCVLSSSTTVSSTAKPMLYPPGSQKGWESHSPSRHVLTTVLPWLKRKKKIAYQLAVTFGHITFRGTARVLSILTGPLHRQRAVTTEGVDQAGWKIYTNIIYTYITKDDKFSRWLLSDSFHICVHFTKSFVIHSHLCSSFLSAYSSSWRWKSLRLIT